MTDHTASLGSAARRHHRTGANARSRPRDTGPSNKESSPSFLELSASGVAVVEVETAVLRAAKARQAGRFLRGPIRMRDIAAASKLPGRALAVFLAVHHRTALTRSSAVKLPGALLRELGVNKDAKARALHQLEAAGLLSVRRNPGRSPTIELKLTSNE